tara:strand:- start:1865 stop:2737 length:873 start_codon:yes stop_codon:yes gene_type:complete
MKGIIYSGLFCLLIACMNDNKQFDVLKDQSIYRLVAFDDDGQKLTEGQFLSSYITITDTLGDTLHYVPSYHYFIEYYPESPIYEALSMLSTGDSAHFRIKESQLYDAFSFDQLSENGNRVLDLRIRAEYLVDESVVKDTLMAELSKRLENEGRLINNFIARQLEPQSFIEGMGIYKKSVIMSLEGSPIEAGDRVTLEYDGSFLNGYIFDSKYGADALEITYGMSDQIVPGLSLAIKGMRVGEIVKIILPSHHAFGGRGSVKGIVPPYTPVVYNLYIKNVIRTNNNEEERN